MEYLGAIQSQQHSQLANILNEHKFTDITFIIGDEVARYNVNRIFLASISTEFDGLFDNKAQNEFMINDIDPKAFECVLNYAYANNPNITSENVLFVLYICNKYKITSLSALCQQYFDMNLCGQNVCLLLDDAVKLNLEQYIKKCVEYLTKNVDESKVIVETEGFIKMHLKAIRIFLELDGLAIEENVLWERILNWADYQSNHSNIKSLDLNNNITDDIKENDQSIKPKEYRLYLLKSIRDLIRFGLMKGPYFVDKVMPEKVLNDQEVISVLAYSYQPKMGCLFNTKPRKYYQYRSRSKPRNVAPQELYTENVKSAQRKQINQLLNTNKFKNIEFIVDKTKQKFSFNRLFLASTSPVFEAMLYGQMKESKSDDPVIIDDIDANAFQCILNFAYCADPNITPKQVLDVAHICDKYQLSFLLKQCEKYFNKCIDAENVCLLLNETVKLSLSAFIFKCKCYINNNEKITKILNSTTFCQMKLAAMRIFLQCKLPFKEEKIWERLLDWNKYQNNDNVSDSDEKEQEQTHKSHLLKSVRDLIRFGLMDGKYFAIKVAPENILTQHELVTVLLYLQNANAGCGQFNTNRRVPKPKSEVEILKLENQTLKQKIETIQKQSQIENQTLKQKIEKEERLIMELEKYKKLLNEAQNIYTLERVWDA